VFEDADKTKQCFAAVVAALAGEAGVSVGQTGRRGFGSSALQVNGKIFAMISSAGTLVVKLPGKRVEELEASGVGAKFDPGHGRLMKEWLALDRGALQRFPALAREALHFVGARA
jgi:TfoX/Sxy family transcriptional regulator of competence genes